MNKDIKEWIRLLYSQGPPVLPDIFLGTLKDHLWSGTITLKHNKLKDIEILKDIMPVTDSAMSDSIPLIIEPVYGTNEFSIRFPGEQGAVFLFIFLKILALHKIEAQIVLLNTLTTSCIVPSSPLLQLTILVENDKEVEYSLCRGHWKIDIDEDSLTPVGGFITTTE